MLAKYHGHVVGCFVAQINDRSQSRLISLKAEDLPVRYLILIINVLTSEMSKRI